MVFGNGFTPKLLAANQICSCFYYTCLMIVIWTQASSEQLRYFDYYLVKRPDGSLEFFCHYKYPAARQETEEVMLSPTFHPSIGSEDLHLSRMKSVSESA